MISRPATVPMARRNNRAAGPIACQMSGLR